MAGDYIKAVEKQAMNDLNKLNKSQQQSILDAYRTAGRRLANGYRSSRNNTATQALYASYIRKITQETEDIIKEYGIKGARIPLDVEKLIMTEAFQRAGLDTSLVNDKFENIIGKLGMESVKNVIGGKIYKDGAGLSSRIWQASAMARNRIQEVIAAGLAQNLGAARLSRLLQDYVNPNARNTWDTNKIRSILGDGYASWNRNLEYNALRLARTTLSHTATMSMRQARKVNPYATKIKWHSVHAAGRTCSTCEEMDGQVYDTEKCPFDHPNGMCYQTHEMEKSLDEIADELAGWCNGEENERLDEWWENLTGEKPSHVIKQAMMYNMISRQQLKQMSEYHRCNNPTSDEFRQIYNHYVSTPESFDINAYLRNLPEGTDAKEFLDVIKSLDTAVGEFVFDDNVKLRRFVDSDYLDGTFGSSSVDDISRAIGNVYKNRQYLSTTVDSNPYFNDRPAIMTIQCDRGTHAFPTTNYSEGEIILGRNNQYELIDVIDHSGDNPLSLSYEHFGRTRTFDYSGLELVVRIVENGV